MTPGAVEGNAKSDDASGARNGWFVGHFMDAGDLRHSTDVEIKWGIHPAGGRNAGGFVVNTRAKSLSILISGHFRLWFRDSAEPESVDTVA